MMKKLKINSWHQLGHAVYLDPSMLAQSALFSIEFLSEVRILTNGLISRLKNKNLAPLNDLEYYFLSLYGEYVKAKIGQIDIYDEDNILENFDIFLSELIELDLIFKSQIFKDIKIKSTAQ